MSLLSVARRLGLTIAVALFATAAPALAQSEPTFPTLSGRVVDEAELLTPTAEARITEKLATLERDTGDQFVVVTIPDLQDYEIEDYGYRLGRAWGIGQSENDSGVLLIVAPTERKVRIEVGYGLEPVLTDAFSSQVIQNDILPSFRTGAYMVGIDQGVDAVIAQLRLDPAEAAARAAAVEPAKADMPVGPAIVVGLVFLFLMIGLIGGASSGGKRRRGGVAPILVWAAADALSHAMRNGGGGSSYRSSGGSSFGGGGGFSGGGGSFGGGGASGGW